jgi:DNA-J related protein/DnaJ domain
MNNPLKRPILHLLQQTLQPLKEYELHDLLGNEAFAEFVTGCENDLRLFRQHFMVMNALYSLYEELLEQGLLLHISALSIYIESPDSSVSENYDLCTAATISREGFQRLSHYYQNWDNFDKTSYSDVQQLLNQFWKKYLQLDEQQKSLDCLGLKKGSDWIKIKQHYRLLCQKHHPDKGGDKLYFLEIRQAYDNLKQHYTLHN